MIISTNPSCIELRNQYAPITDQVRIEYVISAQNIAAGVNHVLHSLGLRICAERSR